MKLNNGDVKIKPTDLIKTTSDQKKKDKSNGEPKLQKTPSSQILNGASNGTKSKEEEKKATAKINNSN